MDFGFILFVCLRQCPQILCDLISSDFHVRIMLEFLVVSYFFYNRQFFYFNTMMLLGEKHSQVTEFRASLRGHRLHETGLNTEMILHLKTYLSTEELEKLMSVPFVFEFSFHFCIYFLFYGMFVRGSFLIIYCDFAFHRKFLVFDFVIYFLFFIFYFKFVCFNFCSGGA